MANDVVDGGLGGGPDRGADGTDGAPDQTRDPALRAAMAAMVDAMVRTAGSNRRLEELSGVSEATVRNFRAGRFPQTSTAKARQLDDWAGGALEDHPDAGAPGSLTDLMARWQGRPVEPEQQPSGPSYAGVRWGLLAAGVGVLVLLAGAGLAARSLLDDGSEASGVPGVRVDRDLALDADSFCGWTLGTDPIPLVSADPLVMRSDARCNDPAEPDPVLDVGASVYDAPDNDTGTRVGRIRSGNSFVPQCWVESSDEVGDGSDPVNRSSLWIRVEEPAGFLPVVNVGGGYTAEQLDALDLARC